VISDFSLLSVTNVRSAPCAICNYQYTSMKSVLLRFSRPGDWTVLAWPAWLRVLAVLPAVLLLWLAVWWALAGEVPW
jgi:hypothetical protein